MENKVKNYEAPSIEMLSICIEGVLCLSRSYNSQGLMYQTQKVDTKIFIS